jgi:hypothetical protein
MRAHQMAQQKAVPKVARKEQLLVDRSVCSKGRPTALNSESLKAVHWALQKDHHSAG